MNRIAQDKFASSALTAGENDSAASGLLRQPRVCYAPVTYMSETTVFIIL